MLLRLMLWIVMVNRLLRRWLLLLCIWWRGLRLRLSLGLRLPTGVY